MPKTFPHIHFKDWVNVNWIERVFVAIYIHIVTCYLLTRRIICGLRIFVSQFIGFTSGGVALADYTSNLKSHKPVTSFGSYSWGTAVSNSCDELLWRNSYDKLLSPTVRDELLFQTAAIDSYHQTALADSNGRPLRNQSSTAFIISVINCWSICCHDICVLTDRYWVATIPQLFWLPRLFCLQNCWEQFSCIRGYIILMNYISVAWQWVFPALGNSAFRTTCHNSMVSWVTVRCRLVS
jgi:hypothetical protein